MSNIQLYDKLNDPVSAIKSLGTMFAKSGMFGCEREEQGHPLSRTEYIELVETHNLVRALRRLSDVKGWGNEPKKRALYHALCIDGSFNNQILQDVRMALGLP